MAVDSRAVLGRLAPVVPEAVARRAEQWRTSDVAVSAAPSASVVLIREQAGLQVYLMHRHARMPFAPSMVVFPGGRMDAADGTDPVGQIRACAVRETLEETGVALAPADLLPWAHWITPEVEPRRFDTHFFVAVLPAGQSASDISGETDSADWARPEDALAAAGRGEIALMPPTWSILMELAEAGSVAAVLQAAEDRVIGPVLPEVVNAGGGWVFSYPAPSGPVIGSPVEMITGYLRLVSAPNPGPMTLDGTNTWIVGDPSRGSVVVVDPGPKDQDHLDSIMEICARGIAEIVITHRHHDHSEAASVLAARAGCRVWAADPAYRVGDAVLEDGTSIAVPGAELVALATPGHTSDSVSLLLSGTDGGRWLLTGDMVLGRGTTVITHPDGDLAAYLKSLDVMEAAVAEHGVQQILPGHGPRVSEPLQLLRSYRTHRLERLEQVRAALAAGARTPAEVVALVYADIDPRVRPAAEQSVSAQLDYLSGRSSE